MTKEGILTVTDGKFTAPVTGRYLVIGRLNCEGITSSSGSPRIGIVASNRNFYAFHDAGNAGTTALTITSLIDMESGDTCEITLRTTGEGSDVVDVEGVNDMRSSISVHMVA